MKKLLSILAAVLFAGSMIAGEALNTDFTQGQGDWTINNVELDGLDNVWAQDNTYGMKATAYVNKANHATESWLISPAISLADATKAELAFSHARRYGSNDHLSVKATADGSNWTTLTVSAWPDGSNWNYVDATADLSAFVGEESVKIAFVYTSTSSAAATWEIKTVVVSFEAQSDEPGGDEPGGDEPGGDEPGETPTELNTDFTQGQGDWTINNVELDGIDFVWAQDKTYGMKATAYVNKANHATESWLISPAISLADATKAELAFSHARRYGSNDHLSVKATADDLNWTTLTVSAWPDGSNWNYIDATADLSAFVGEESVKIAFVYTSTSSAAATWEIKTVTISSEAQSDEPGGDDPVVESAYYLAGSMNSWAPAEAYKFAANPSQDGEFVLNTTLEVGDEFKVARSDNGTSFADDAWYPQGMNNNFVVTEDYAGEKTIYFRPAGNEAWDQLEGYIYVAANEVPVEEEILTCAKAAELALAGNTDQVTVKGYVTGIVEEWSGYKNISFWMADTKDGGQVFEAFRVVCENEADAPGVGDLVKVTGTLTKYTKNGVTIAETTAGGSFEILEKAETGGEEQPTDPVELTCAAAAEAALSVSTDNEAYNNGAKYFVRGYVTGIKTAWSNNKMTFWVADAEDGGEVLQVYNCAILSEEEAVAVGDYVQVTGKLTKFKSTPQFVAGSVCEILEKSVPAVNLGATSIAEFLEMKNAKDTCVLTGIVANIKMDGEVYNQYGNFDLVDENDQDVKVYIYGLLTADGQSKKFREMGIDAGDLLTLKAVYGEHNGEPQAANAIFVKVVKNETTGISNAAVEVKAQKVIRDGQLYIMRNGVLYNANGAVVK